MVRNFETLREHAIHGRHLHPVADACVRIDRETLVTEDIKRKRGTQHGAINPARRAQRNHSI